MEWSMYSSDREAMAARTYWRPVSACLRAGLLQEAAGLVQDYYQTGQSSPTHRLTFLVSLDPSF